MMRVVHTRQAREDLLSIWSYIAAYPNNVRVKRAARITAPFTLAIRK